MPWYGGFALGGGSGLHAVAAVSFVLVLSFAMDVGSGRLVVSRLRLVNLANRTATAFFSWLRLMVAQIRTRKVYKSHRLATELRRVSARTYSVICLVDRTALSYAPIASVETPPPNPYVPARKEVGRWETSHFKATAPGVYLAGRNGGRFLETPTDLVSLYQDREIWKFLKYRYI